jgi:putative transposase
MLAPFITAHGITIGRDAFFELLRGCGLLVKKRRCSKPQTTFSGHWLRKYDNLSIGFVPRAAGQLWVSDITYIHLEEGFAHLSLITDAYSHKIIGFYLSEDLAARGCITSQLPSTRLPDSSFELGHPVLQPMLCSVAGAEMHCHFLDAKQ